jgi:hypothetical protein
MRYEDARNLNLVVKQYAALLERLAAAEARLAELEAQASKKQTETLALRRDRSRGQIN